MNSESGLTGAFFLRAFQRITFSMGAGHGSACIQANGLVCYPCKRRCTGHIMQSILKILFCVINVARVNVTLWPLISNPGSFLTIWIAL